MIFFTSKLTEFLKSGFLDLQKTGEGNGREFL